MNELVVYPVIGLPLTLLVVFGTLAELEELSYKASESAVEYAQDAINALDCAFKARPLTECSPNIMHPDYAEEIERTQALLAPDH